MTVFPRAGTVLFPLLMLVCAPASAQPAPLAEPRQRSVVLAPPAVPDAPAPAPSPTVSPAPEQQGAASQPAARTPPTLDPSPPTPSSNLPTPEPTERKPPALDIEVPANIVGPKPNSPKQMPGTASGESITTPGLRGIKRLNRDEILAATSDTFSTYVLRDNERTLVLDFPNTREQARMFARLILFVERAGSPKTRVMSVPEAQRWLAENSVQFETLTVGNNMRTGELARFFNSAHFQGEPITIDEQRLYDWLVQTQLLREEGAGVAVVEPERILVSLPQVSTVAGCTACSVTAAQRAVILQHELSHARFATDTVYQNYALWFWSNSMSFVLRDKFTRFLRSRGYDSSIRELCANEMQAFLMHTPDPAVFSASDVGISDAELADLRRRFQEGIRPKPRASADKPYQFE